MRCTEAGPLFPLYLDGAVTGVEMHALAEHMTSCRQCCSEYNKLENSRQLVAALGRAPAPPDLALRIRIAIARERSRSLRSLIGGHAPRIEEAINSLMFPAPAGRLSAVIFFCVLAGVFFCAPARSAQCVPPLVSAARPPPP